MRDTLPNDEVSREDNLTDALLQVQRSIPDLVIMDAMIPEAPGLGEYAEATFFVGEFVERTEDICETSSKRSPEVIVVSGRQEPTEHFGHLEQWLEGGRVYDLIPKSMADPGWHFFQAVLRQRVKRIRLLKSLSDDSGNEAFAELARYGIITRHSSMIEVYRYMLVAATTLRGTPVPIEGDTGTGKELMAHAIHEMDRPRLPFVVVRAPA